MRTAPVVLVLSSLFVGCAGVTLTTDKDRYAHGDTVTFTLRNGTASKVGYNLCGTPLVAADGSGRTESSLPEGSACTLELRMLGPGGEDSSRFVVGEKIPPGPYQLAADVEVGGERKTVSSETFEISAPPAQ